MKSAFASGGEAARKSATGALAAGKRPRRVWITWETQRRNRTLSRKVGAELFEIDMNVHRLLRYPLSLLKTVAVLLRTRPKLLFVQNPSLILAFFAVFYGRCFRLRVIVDAHNAGLFPLEGRNPWLNKIAARILRLATITIVSNEGLTAYVRSHGGTPFVLPDPIPDFEAPAEESQLRGKFNVLFVCSWAADEPFREVVRAAQLLDEDVFIHMTGSRQKAERRLGADLPRNVVLTGYLSETEYTRMLHSCDVVIVLTTRDDCLVCGGYESVAAEKPLILSDTAVLREFFSRGALYTNNTAEDIASKIEKAIQVKDTLRSDIVALKRDLRGREDGALTAFEEQLRALSIGT